MTMPSAKPTPLGLNENRKASKPLIEKRRRARINNSLAQLKSMVVGSVQSNQSPNGKPPKLEKADILEMTVAHLKKMHHGLMKAPDDDKYMAGFSYCMKEVRHFIESNIDNESKSRVLTYLNCFANRILISGTNQCPMQDLESGNMDDSSCSSNSRSETPSSTFTESSPTDYHSCSPCPENQPEPSTASFNRTFSSECRLQPENAKWAYASPDSSSSQMTLVPALNSNSTASNMQRDINDSAHPSPRLGPLNLSYQTSNRNHHDSIGEGHVHQRNVILQSCHQLRSNFSDNANLERRSSYCNDQLPRQQLIMPNSFDHEHLNESVWRPW